LQKRITYANRAAHYVLPLLKSQPELRAEETKFYKTLTRPVATEGAASWTLNKWLAAFERTVLRMFGAIK
jgi:hypothetical protein